MDIKYDNTFSDLNEYLKSEGFFYKPETLYNFYTSLVTKPFVILSGISGSGKSKIADLFASYMARSFKNTDNYEMVAVKPNWMDNRGIFGYHNLINDTYQITPTIRLFLRALANPDKPYFLVLDEMNLAKVEYYFSDFLSLLESRRLNQGKELGTNFEILKNKNMTLSEAIVISALQLNSDHFEPVERFRKMPIIDWWTKKYSKIEAEDVSQAQFRTELNQKRTNGTPVIGDTTGIYKNNGSRLAGKLFLAEKQGDSYKLKSEQQMDENERFKFNEILDKYTKSIQSFSVSQKKISLHNSLDPLKTDESLPLYQSNQLYDENSGYYYVPNEIEIPLNVFVIGTVNVDETTYMFSPKVLDRSNVLEFNDVDFQGAFGYQESMTSDNNTDVNQSEIHSNQDMLNILSNFVLRPTVTIATADVTKQLINNYPDIFKVIKDIYDISKEHNRHFGYRVFNEISLYILNYLQPLGAEDSSQLQTEMLFNALDNQILQKILPKISGSENELLPYLNELKKYCSEIPQLTGSSHKVEKMIKRVTTNGYVTFIE